MNRIVIVAAALLAAALVCGCARHVQEKPYSVSEPPASIESAQSVMLSALPAHPHPNLNRLCPNLKRPKPLLCPNCLSKQRFYRGIFSSCA